MRPKSVVQIVLLTLILGGCNGTKGRSVNPSARLARPVHLDLSLPTTDGRRFVLSSLRGKVVILNFFTIGCLKCQALFDRFLRTQRAYGAHRVAIVGVAVDRQFTLVKMYAQALTVPFPILAAGSTLIQASRPLRVRVVPLTLVLDRQGRVRFAHRKMVTTRELAREVASLF